MQVNRLFEEDRKPVVLINIAFDIFQQLHFKLAAKPPTLPIEKFREAFVIAIDAALLLFDLLIEFSERNVCFLLCVDTETGEQEYEQTRKHER